MVKLQYVIYCMQIWIRSTFDVNRRAAPAAKIATRNFKVSNKADHVVSGSEAAIRMEQGEAATHRTHPND